MKTKKTVAIKVRSNVRAGAGENPTTRSGHVVAGNGGYGN
jgi:hypothetical protein